MNNMNSGSNFDIDLTNHRELQTLLSQQQKRVKKPFLVLVPTLTKRNVLKIFRKIRTYLVGNKGVFRIAPDTMGLLDKCFLDIYNHYYFTLNTKPFID